jgi:hypothetical protein
VRPQLFRDKVKCLVAGDERVKRLQNRTIHFHRRSFLCGMAAFLEDTTGFPPLQFFPDEKNSGILESIFQ